MKGKALMATNSQDQAFVSIARLPILLKPFAYIERILAWLLAYPVLLLQIVLLLLMSWGGLGKSLGLPDLFWHERILTQFWLGLAVGLLIGEIYLVRYLLDHGRDRFRFQFSLFGSTEPKITRLGEYLLLLWPLTLVVLAAPKLLANDFWSRRSSVPAWPMFLGLTSSILLGAGLVRLGEWLSVRQRLQGSWLFRHLPGVSFGYLPPEDYPLHALALELGLLSLLGLTAAYAVYFAGVTFTPLVALCLLLGSFNALYGFVASQLRGLQHVAFVSLFALAVVLNSDRVDSDHAYKLSFPNMESYYADIRARARTRVRLDEDQDNVDHYRKLIEEAPVTGLIESQEPLRAMLQRWQDAHSGTKPRLVLVATSGGGIRAAVWTAVVLEGLETEIPHLRDHIRLITGASGGMVGSALYVADFENTPVGKRPFDASTGLGLEFSKRLASDSLSRPVQTMLLEDFPSLWKSGDVDRDRGRELENSWHRNTAKADGQSPLQRTFEELKPLERQGLRPSLIFSPMLVEDARRLLISNLDLERLTRTWGEQLSLEPTGISPLKPMLSLSAVEFWRLFPQAKKFEVGTAARMNASFPLVSPGISLPTDPPRRVVDAGYYDNYGTNLAAIWVHHHQELLKQLTSGVVLIEIRAYRNGYARRHFQDKQKEKTNPLGPGQDTPREQERPDADLLTQSLEWLSTPAEAVLTARDRAAYYRNDELLHILDALLNQGNDRKFFTTVAFECSQDAALSWTLPESEAAQLVKGFYSDTSRTTKPIWIQKRVNELREWFGEGGR
jgi:hypothetical protein